MRFSHWISLTLLLVATLAGCEPTDLTVDGGPAVDASGPTGGLELLSPPSVSLTVGEETTIEVRYEEEGQPVAGVELQFALLGTAHDSAVGDLAMATGPDGVARTTLSAGTIAGPFRVRVRTDRAAPVHVDVSVGAEGFGMIRVSSEYDGRRNEGNRRVFRVYSGTHCAPTDGYPSFADRAATLDDPGELDVTWSLPVGLTYTVVAELESSTGVVLAEGCVDEVTMTANAETPVIVRLGDVALQPMGRYNATLEIQPSAATAEVVRLGGEASEATLAETTDAALYLDALEAELRRLDQRGAADAMAAGREAKEQSLAEDLDEASLGPREALSRFWTRVEERLAVVRVSGPLTLAPSGMELGGIWTAEALVISAAAGPDAPPPVALAPEGLNRALAPVLTLAWRPEADLVDVESMTLTVRLWVLVSALLDAWEAVSPEALLLDGAGCEVLDAWVAEDTSLSEVCDASCVSHACEAALSPIAVAIRETATAGEGLRDTITLSGTIAISDDDGDLAVDRFEGRGLTGAWGGPADMDVITGDWVGTRVSTE